MINIDKLEKYCCEDFSLIENFEKALEDETTVWCCHHKLGETISRKKLKELGLYFKRPASELILLTNSEHTKIHHPPKQKPEKKRKKLKPVPLRKNYKKNF